jgi:hypothetical protein
VATRGGDLEGQRLNSVHHQQRAPVGVETAEFFGSHYAERRENSGEEVGFAGGVRDGNAADTTTLC